MNAIEIKNLTKCFKEKIAVNNLNMTVPMGAIYGFIGENGSGKSTTEKIICGLILPTSGSIKLYDRDYRNPDIRMEVGSLIEFPGCYPNYTVWNNLMLHALNLNLPQPDEEVRRVLKLVRMEGAASNKFKNCSLGMKQRIGIALTLLGNPSLLILDEPINGLDADGMRIMREILVDITKDKKCSVLISSHILSELEKIATHYGIIKDGKMIVEMTAQELDRKCPRYISLKTIEQENTRLVLLKKYLRVEQDENGYLRVYGAKSPSEVANYLYENNIIVNELMTSKISLEEYYLNLIKTEGGK